MAKRKYEFTGEKIELDDGRKLHRIRALKDFNGVKKGQLGGFIESEDCLSHERQCWVGDDAKVYGKSSISLDVRVLDNAEVYCSNVSGCSMIKGSAQVADSTIEDSAIISDDAYVFGSLIYGRAQVYNNARLIGRDKSVKVGNLAEVFEKATVMGAVEIMNAARVYGTSWILNPMLPDGSSPLPIIISGYAQVYDQGEVNRQGIIVSGEQEVYGNQVLGYDFKQIGDKLDHLHLAISKKYHPSREPLDQLILNLDNKQLWLEKESAAYL